MTNNFQNLTPQEVFNTYIAGDTISIGAHIGVITLPLDSALLYPKQQRLHLQQIAM
jgi:hypothetical protein